MFIQSLVRVAGNVLRTAAVGNCETINCKAKIMKMRKRKLPLNELSPIAGMTAVSGSYHLYYGLIKSKLMPPLGSGQEWSI